VGGWGGGGGAAAGSTSTSAIADCPSAPAATKVIPGVRPVTRPSGDTLATDESLLTQTTDCPERARP